jgi:hypothetical protein
MDKLPTSNLNNKNTNIVTNLLNGGLELENLKSSFTTVITDIKKTHIEASCFIIRPLSDQSTHTRNNAMAFSAVPATTGAPDFKVIHIVPEEVAKCFQAYLDSASKLTGVSIDEIQLGVARLPADLTKATLVDLLECGMLLFDAIVWLTAGRPTSHPLIIDPALKVGDIQPLQTVAKAVFYCYFMLIVQARYPASSRSSDKPVIPNFLRTIMGMDKDQHTYVEAICSFEPQKFDPKWVRFVSFKGFGQEVLSRFGLGVAGYRYFSPFALYSPKPGVPQNLLDAVQFAKTVATTGASWDIHPLTRDPTVLTKRGNLNKNLSNLILDVFSDKDIEEMATAKVIFAKPKREPTHRNYTQWAINDDISGTSRIFS